MSRAVALRYVGLAACMTALVFAAGASATFAREAAIDPGTPVNGMVVVQGLARDANYSLFGVFCDPVVLRPGRRTRSCGRVPHFPRIFVGHGVFALTRKQLDKVWDELTWGLWIDGQHVSLSRFGTADRWLYGFPPARGRNVVLREWSIILVGAEGRHSIRYRTRWPSGTVSMSDSVTDVTWRFSVAAN